ncbi:MAG: M23 family metallopeptidase [Micrococcales bacterium]|nr:M23 family metallopeptidase [Micrococcales bacterium]
MRTYRFHNYTSEQTGFPPPENKANEALKTQKNLCMKVLFATLALVSSQIPASGNNWLYPVPEGFVINQYYAPAGKYASGHRGIDLYAALNQTIVAPESGQISFVGQVGFRNVVTIAIPTGTITLEPVCSDQVSGSPIVKGATIGTLCQPEENYSWHCASTCLHLGFKTENGYLSPELFLDGLSPSRLLP